MDWQRFIFNPQERWLDKLDRRTRMRFIDENLAMEAYNYALEKLSDQHFSRLGNFHERSSPGSYLMSVFNNLLEDYSRHVFGRPRAPRWLERMGELWVRTWKMLCLERQDIVMVKEILQKRPDLETDDITGMIRVIKAKVTDCGQRLGGIAVENVPDGMEFSGLSDGIERYPVDEQLQQQDVSHLLEALGLLLDNDQILQKKNLDSCMQEDNWIGQLALEDEEWLLLRLVYQQNKKISAAARMLDIKDHNARRMLKRAEAKILQGLEKAGVCFE